MLLFDPKKFRYIADLSPHIKSIVWEEAERTPEGGSFKIVMDEYYQATLELDLFLYNPKGSKFGIINSIHRKYNDENGIQELLIEGYMLESLLMRRRVIPQLQLKGTPQKIITDILNRNIINTTKSRRNMPIILNFCEDMMTDEVEYAFEDGAGLAESLITICTNLKLFYYFTIDSENKKLVLNFEKEKDKTKEVIFSYNRNNLYDISTLKTTKNKINCAVVKGDIINSSVPFVYSYDDEKSGIYRIEGFVDHSDLDSENIAEGDYLKMLKKFGDEELTNAQVDTAFDFAIFNHQYEYPAEVALGDVVSVQIKNYSTQSLRIVSYLYTLSSNNLEETSFTFAKDPEIISGDDYAELEDVPEDEIDDVVSDATSTGANKESKGVEIVGRILCDGCEALDGTIQKLGEKLYRVNVYAWDENPMTTKIEYAENGDEIQIEVVDPKPFMGKIYLKVPFDILSYVETDTGTIDIDNFDGSLTRIDIASATKGILYRDSLMEGNPLVFELPGDWNVDGDIYYEYSITSENMNFNASFTVSLDPVLETVPLKAYNRDYGSYLMSFTASRPFNVSDPFVSDNFVADEGDYVKLKFWYRPILHTKNAEKPWTVDNTTPAEWREIVYTFSNRQLVSKYIFRLPEGCYDFWGGEAGVFSSFKKLNYLKEVALTEYYEHEGLGAMDIKSIGADSVDNFSVNGVCIIKQDPAFDPGADSAKFLFYNAKLIDEGADVEYPTQMKPLRFRLCTNIKKEGPDGSHLPAPDNALRDLCNDLDEWDRIKAEWEASKA